MPRHPALEALPDSVVAQLGDVMGEDAIVDLLSRFVSHAQTTLAALRADAAANDAAALARNAHALVGAAGILSLDGLVTAARRIELEAARLDPRTRDALIDAIAEDLADLREVLDT